VYVLKISTSSKLARLLDTASKFALVLVSDLKDEKLIKKSKPTRKLKHANSILESFDYFYQMSSKSILTISSYTVLNLVRFLRHSVTIISSTTTLRFNNNVVARAGASTTLASFIRAIKTVDFSKYLRYS